MREEMPVSQSAQPQPGEPEAYDAMHAAAAEKGLSSRLYAEAFGDEYPAEVDPSSSCTWSVLGEMVKALRLRPDDLLVDLGCGRGGTGLWLARAFSARLAGVDFSPVAVRLATERIPEFFPGHPAGSDRTRFQVGTFESTGLPDACASGVVSMDALPFASDRDRALREMRRIMKPGARAVFTGIRKLPGHPTYEPGQTTWEERIAAAGLDLVTKIDRPEERGLWDRLNDLWEMHEGDLRRENGDVDTDAKLAEARGLRPGRPYRIASLFVVRAGQVVP
jgi:SAM-dependent methyltransferase